MTTVKFLGSVALAIMLLAGTAALARDAPRPRGVNAARATQPHTRTTERQRTENGRTRTDTWTGPNGKTATRNAEVTNDREAGTRTREVDYTGPNGKTASVDSVRTRTDDGFTRTTTATNAQGETATRTLDVSRNAETGTITRTASASDDAGVERSSRKVIERTEDGYSRDSARTLPNGETHTRAVDVSCDKDAKTCVKLVEVDKP